MGNVDISLLFKKQREFFSTGATLDVDFRVEWLKKLKRAILKQSSHIEQALYADLYKSSTEAYMTEISFTLKEIDVHIKNLKSWSRPEKVRVPLFMFPSKGRIISEPHGVVLVIAPWNYPFLLLMTPLIGAISAGNCAILKSSPNSPNTSKVMMGILAEIFDDEYVAMVEGGREVNSNLLAEKFDYIFFTGSTSLGRVVMRAAAENLTPLTLELGGKSPCVVDNCANVEVAARRIVWGKFLNAGQTCIAPDYVLLQRDVADKFIDALKREITRQLGQDPIVSQNYCRIVNDESFDRLNATLTDGDIVVGAVVDRSQRYISPTVIKNVKQDSELLRREIFGPILPIILYSEIQEAVSYITKGDKPLALYYFGSCTSKADYLFQHTSSGGGCINDVIIHIAADKLPFGGVGASGMGRYHGKASFDTFSNKRSVVVSSTFIDIKIKYPPYSKSKLWFLRKLM